MEHKQARRPLRTAGRYVLIGLVTAAPLVITWFVLDFLFGLLASVGRPWANALARAVKLQYPDLADWLLNETLQSVVATIIVLSGLYLLGWATTRVLGRRLIDVFEGLIGMIPFVDTIYRSIKNLMTVAAITPEGRPQTERRVVLISFPSPEMKAVGLITRVLKDTKTGEELAAVYVPTSPNPTSGYIEIVPLRDVVYTDWSFDQAMAFVVTGGSTAPETVTFKSEPAPVKPPKSKTSPQRRA